MPANLNQQQLLQIYTVATKDVIIIFFREKMTMGRPSSEEIGHHIAFQAYKICGTLEDRHTREHRLDSIEEDGEGQQK